MQLSDMNNIPLWIVMLALIVFIILLLVALITGREVSIWQIKIGGKKEPNKSTSKEKSLSNSDKEKFRADLTTAIIAFFKSYDGYTSPAQIIGEAKGIVSRFPSELQNTVNNVQRDIQFKKQNDANWTYANMLRDGLLLVNYLGLTHQTTAKNEIFTEMTMPQI